MTVLTPVTAALAIRLATLDDVPQLVTLGRAEVSALYGELIADNPAQLETLMEALILGPQSALFVAARDGLLLGMIGMLVVVHHASGVRTAVEVMWWMDPAARGGGRALLTRAERWAAEQGARQIQLVAPASHARVGRLYERRGYQALETSYQAPVTPAMTALTVVDDVLPEFAATQAASRRQPFGDLEPSPGVVFHGIATPIDDRLLQAIQARWPGLTPTLTVLRRSPAGQVEPHFIHTDADMGDWSAIYTLTADPAPGDGTLFWRWRETDAIRSLPGTGAEPFTDLAQWEPWTLIEARPNRLIVFPSCYFHSRALVDNSGAGDTARLVQLVFGTGVWPPEGA